MRSGESARVAATLLAGVALASVAGCAATGVANMDSAVSEARSYLRQQLLSSDNPVVRTQAIEGMQTTPWPEATRYIKDRLADPHRGVRFAAAMALGRLADPSAADLLQSLLDDPSPAVRAAAIYALHRVGQSARLKELAQLLLYSSDEEVRRNVALVFCELNDPGAKPVLKRALRDNDMAVRWYVYEALARIGEKEALESLVLFAHSSYGDERLIGILALGRIGNRQAAAALRDMLGRSNAPEVKLAAIRSLGQIGMPAGQDIALSALTFTPEPPGKQAVYEPQDVRQIRVRTMAALALAEAGDLESVPALLDRMRHDDPRVAVAAAAAVLRIASRTGWARTGTATGG
jgi:HEAT repeat protein